MSEHTEGKWQEVGRDSFGVDIGVPCEDGIGHYAVCEVDSNNTDADARLIAAAPELLEACNPDFLEWVAVDIMQERGDCQPVERLREMSRAQRKAIAKAVGAR